MALSWVLNDRRVTSVIVGCSSAGQLADSIQAVNHTDFTEAELKAIETILNK